MENSQLITIIDSLRADALGHEGSSVTNERARALDHYHGRPYGDEVEGKSQYVSKDLSETIDWIMPAIMNVFLRSGDLVEFPARNEEDEKLAEQENDYTNHVIMEDNNGYMVLHDAIKDALILKNGYFKHWWEETEEITEEEYEGMDDQQLAKLFQELREEDTDTEIKEQDRDETGWKVKLKLIRHNRGVRIEAVPTEEVRVSRRCRGSLQTSPYTEHWSVTKTRSELIEMGMPKKFVNDLPMYGENDNQNSAQQRARDSVYQSRDDHTDLNSDSLTDRSMDIIEYSEVYLKVDFDEDGIAELRRVTVVGGEIPPGKEWNEVIDSVSMTGMVPKRVPHRHIGESIDDELQDLQRLKTIITRQLLDNVYSSNNAEWLVNDRVNKADFLESLPGGVKRVNDDQPVQGSAQMIEIPQIAQYLLPILSYVDTVKDNRTGINKTTTGVDPDILKHTTKGAYMENLNRATQKVEMIIRMLAETGIKELVIQVHKLLIKHQVKSRVVKLRGEYVQVNPQEWKNRTDLRVKVGLGTGTEDEKREKLMLTASLQEKLSEKAGLIGPQHAYSLYKEILETFGFQNPEKFAFDPSTPEFAKFQQQQEAKAKEAQQEASQNNMLADAERVKGQANAQIEQMKQQFKAQSESIKLQSEHQIEVFKTQFAEASKQKDRESAEAIAAMNAEIKAMIEGIKIDLGKPGIGATSTEPGQI